MLNLKLVEGTSSTLWPSSQGARDQAFRWFICERTVRTPKSRRYPSSACEWMPRNGQGSILSLGSKVMSRSIISRYSALGLFLAVALVAAISTRSIAQQQSQDDSQNKHFDVQSSAGDLHLGTDADAKKAGLPLYPGARKRHDDENNSAANPQASSPVPLA